MGGGRGGEACVVWVAWEGDLCRGTIALPHVAFQQREMVEDNEARRRIRGWAG